MVRKEASFFEKYVEKIVLLIVCVISVFLFFYYVILGPCKVAVRGKNLGPSQVDVYLLKEAEKVREKLNEKPQEVALHQTEVADFTKKMASAIVLDDNLYPQIPSYIRSSGVQSKYNLPEIPPIEQVQLEHIRAVAYVPRVEINQDNLYSQAVSEANDIDLVTVEFKFDIAALYKSFNDSFAGPKVKEQWQDKTLAEPLFAAVQLQRQEMLPDGRWNPDWQDVPRSKIDNYGQLLNIVEDVDKLPTGGMQVRLIQYKEKSVQIDLLQPDCYRIASPKEEWFPPSLHSKYITVLGDEQRKQKREAAAAELERRRTSSTVPAAGGRITDPRIAAATATATTGDTAAFEPLYKEFDKILITDTTDLSKMTEPLTVWAFDDTVQPTKTYRYRVRLGVFNPIAGTDRFIDNDNPLRNKVILWTDFFEPRQVAQIPAKLYFFAQSIEEMKKKVTVLVSRYRLGYWSTKDFKVTPGEAIGQKIEKSSSGDGIDNVALAWQFGVTTPREIDYSTGAVILDVVQMTDWTGGSNLYSRVFFEMLYSDDGSKIQRMPIGDKFWPDDLRQAYYAVKAGENAPKKPLRAWSDGKERVKQQILDQRQKQPATNIPGLPPGVTPGMYEQYLIRRGGAPTQ
jgi:hypothetical protein